MLVPLTEGKKKKSPASTHLASQPYCVWELIRMLWAYSTTTEAGCAHGLPLHITGAARVEQRFMCFFADSSCPSHIPWLHDLFPCGIPHYACQWAGRSEVRRVSYHKLWNMQLGIKSRLIEAILDFSKGCLFIISTINQIEGWVQQCFASK